MPGSLGRLDLLPPEDLDIIHDGLTTAYQDAAKALLGRGIDTAGPPQGFHGEMPANLTSLDDGRVGDLLNQLSAWCGYLDVELSKASATKHQAEAHLTTTRARIRLSLKADEEGKKLTGPDKDDRVECDPRVVEATRQELYYYTYYIILRGVRDEAQKNWETVSRRITQRGQEVGRMRRDVGVAGIPVSGGRSFVRRQQT